MKKTCCLIAALLILCAFVLPSCAEERGDAVASLLTQLSACLDAQEQINVWLLDCYRQLGVFFDRQDYASLVRARLACSEYSERLRSAKPPQMALDGDTLLALAQRGVETITLEDKTQEIQSALQDGADQLDLLESFLYSNAVCLRDGLDSGKKLAEDMTQSLALGAAYDCCWLNDLLLPLAGDPQISAFWDLLPVRWPLTAQYRQPWISDSAALIDQGAAILQELENALDGASAAFGMSAYAIERYARDSAVQAADFQRPAGMPDILPLPDFWHASTGRSLHANADDAGDSALPATLIWRVPGVSSEQFLSYVSHLSQAGLEGEAAGNDQEGWKASMKANGKALLMIWQPGGAVLMAYDPSMLTMEAN